MRGVGAVHDVDTVDVGGVFLADALEHTLRSRALHLNGDARILFLEHLGEILGKHQLDGGVEHHLTLGLRLLDQVVGDRRRSRQLCAGMGFRRDE